MHWTLEHLTPEEARHPSILINDRPFDEWARHMVAVSLVDAEETEAVISTRITEPVFLGEPWV